MLLRRLIVSYATVLTCPAPSSSQPCHAYAVLFVFQGSEFGGDGYTDYQDSVVSDRQKVNGILIGYCDIAVVGGYRSFSMAWVSRKRGT